jgi:tagaturonate reductase
MNLSRENLKKIGENGFQKPLDEIFSLPEKVLQFGTGVLLRGLPDYFIDKANKKGLFNGRIVVVKSTGNGDADSFDKQDGLYTHCVKGIENGKPVEETIINASISRVISAQSDWEKVLECALNPELKVIISNTTEVGIALQADDNIKGAPPQSFPGKLLAFLYKRYKVFRGAKDKGFVIIPTELLPGNGEKLEAIVEELAHLNKMDYAFMEWLENCNHFCNSLVDRIVPGKLNAAQQDQLGYKDELAILSEPYCLWAIETVEEVVKNILSFSRADEGIVLAPCIDVHRELKLRLLNGSHSFSCGLAHLAGFQTVKEAMEDREFFSYISGLMMEEIAPAIVNEELHIEGAKNFAAKVLDRYRNPFIDHQWLSICLQYSSKMAMRNIPIILNYLERTGTVPEYMALGFAAHLLFMRSVKDGDGKYYGELNGKKYLVNDDNAGFFSERWKKPGSSFVKDILADESIWHADLGKYPAFIRNSSEKLDLLMKNGSVETIRQVLTEKLIA